MSVGAHEMPDHQEQYEALDARKGLIPGAGDQHLDPYSQRADGYSMEQIRAHNSAVKRLNDIAQGR